MYHREQPKDKVHEYKNVTPSPNLAHVTQANGALAGGVHKKVALLRVEFGSCDHLSQLFHVSWLDVHNVEGLVSDLHMPEIDTEVICRQVSFLKYISVTECIYESCDK